MTDEAATAAAARGRAGGGAAHRRGDAADGLARVRLRARRRRGALHRRRRSPRGCGSAPPRCPARCATCSTPGCWSRSASRAPGRTCTASTRTTCGARSCWPGCRCCETLGARGRGGGRPGRAGPPRRSAAARDPGVLPVQPRGDGRHDRAVEAPPGLAGLALGWTRRPRDLVGRLGLSRSARQVSRCGSAATAAHHDVVRRAGGGQPDVPVVAAPLHPLQAYGVAPGLPHDRRSATSATCTGKPKPDRPRSRSRSRRPGRGARPPAPGAASGVDPAVVEPVGQHQHVGREPVAADVRDLPGLLGVRRGRARRRPAGPARRSRRRAGRGCTRRTAARRRASGPATGRRRGRRGRGRAAPRAVGDAWRLQPRADRVGVRREHPDPGPGRGPAVPAHQQHPHTGSRPRRRAARP